MKKLTKLKKLYAQIPDVGCKGLCSDSCAFIQMSEFEKNNLDKKYGCANYMQDPCPKLTLDGKCGIYEDRPWVCRMWGATKMMPCPHGCKPDAYLADKSAMFIMHRIEKLG